MSNWKSNILFPEVSLNPYATLVVDSEEVFRIGVGVCEDVIKHHACTATVIIGCVHLKDNEQVFQGEG